MKKSVLEHEIVETYANEYCPLCVYAKKIIRDSEEAKDIVSDAFLKIWINREQIQIKQTTKGYLYQCVRNGCLNYLEHVQIKRKYARDASENLDTYYENDPLSSMISKEEQEKIEQSLNSLPSKCKEIFVLAKYKGLSYKEIAGKLKISANTVKRQIAIAMDKMRNGLENKHSKMG